jgi:penicillin-binding protein 1A
MPDNYFYNSSKEPGGPRRQTNKSSVPNKLTEIAISLEAFFRNSERAALLVLAMMAGGLTGLVLAYQANFTTYAAEVDGLADNKLLNEITNVYADDGKTVIGQLSLERRIPIEYKQIPEPLKNAILAIEDTRFYDHLGIDPFRIMGAALQNLVRNRRAQGASTLTQQLAREIFLTREKTYSRKLKEIMYALQIERLYTKEQILTLYCNKIFLGGGAYGFEAASRYYFSRTLKDLSLEQYALLAALPKGPQQFSPIHRAKEARNRRNLVLQSMVDAGYISQSDCNTAKAKPIALNLDDQRGKNDRSPYAYFVEEVRQELQKRMIEKHEEEDAMYIYKAGLSVYTTLDAEAQNWATDAVQHGAQMYEKRHGWRIKFDNIFSQDGATIEDYQHPSWIGIPKQGDTMTGLIKEVSDRGTLVSFGSYSAIIKAENTGVLKKAPSKLFKRGDLAQFKVGEVDNQKKTLSVTLDPEPDVQASLVLVDVRTGEIKAMVGGYNFATSKFNHATQANRQTGSVFKPFVYAAALEQGMKPDDIIDDSPFKEGDYEPHNYDNTFMGAMSLRTALAQSRNIPAVRVLKEIGVRDTGELVKRMGLPNPMAPYLSSALGATEEPLLSLVSAYAAFPNKGVRYEPYRIRRVVDRDGKVLDQAEPKSWKVLSNYIAAQMVDMMRGVVLNGTARNAVSLGHPLAGKTGTMDEYTDAWFIGYTPSVACGVWIGHSDSKKSLGQNESGSTAALPFWNEFMAKYLKDKPRGKFPSIPDIPEEMRPIQAQRAREHAKELARIEARSEDILPGSPELPNLDPLAGSGTPEPSPVKPAPTPPPTARVEQEAKTVRTVTDAKPVKPVEAPPTPEAPARKGKKGKAEDP